MKNPKKLSKLRQELDQAYNEGSLSSPLSYSEAIRTPYLQAVLKEAMRLHPSTGFIMGRTVPKGGATLLGHYIPEGVSRPTLFQVLSQAQHTE
jgi:cytochrome P450